MKFLIYKENRTHGTFNFPFEFYDVTPSHPRYNMMYHWHNEYEIIRVTSGSLILNIDDKKFTSHAGDIIFLKDGTLHGGTPNDCTYECLVFDMKYLLNENHICNDEIFKILNHEKNIQLYFSKYMEEAYDTLTGIFKDMRYKKKGFEFKIQGALYYFLGLVRTNNYYISQSSIPAKNKRRLNQFKKVILYIDENYENYISLDDLANCANMNSRYFCKFFKEMAQKTPMEYLNYYRIECATAKIVLTHKSITDIAFDCGFNDLSYFIKVFKKFKHITPYKYLKNNLGG